MSETDITYDACLIVFNEISVDARALNMAETLAQNGKSVCILAIADISEEEYFSKKGILLYSINKSNYKRMWRRWLDFSTQTNKIKVKASTYWACDLYSLPIAISLKKQFKGKLIYDSREIFSALGPAAASPLKQKVLTWLELRWVAKVDEFIVSGDLDADFLKKHFKTNKPFHIIMNLPPYKKAVESNFLREKFDLSQEKKIILYQGVVLEGRGLLPTVRALKYYEEAMLCIVGSGPFIKKIEEEAVVFGVSDRVLFTGQIPYNQLHEVTSSADLGLCFIEPISFSYELALPNKLFEYAMARIPVLASDLPAMKKIIEEEKIGIAIPPSSSPEEIALALKDLCSEKYSSSFIAACNKSAIKYSYNTQENLILSLV